MSLRSTRWPERCVVACTALVLAAPIAWASPPSAAIGAADDLVRLASWTRSGESPDWPPELDSQPPLVSSFERTELIDGIAHYSADVRFGPGAHDVFRIHRVVRERFAWRPIRTDKTLFLLHGDVVGFVEFILGAASADLPDEHGLAVFLAAEDVDVWGIDQPWVLVPSTETDLSFFANWGMQFNVNCLRRGLAIARAVRAITGSGGAPINLLGYSSGAITTYAYMNEETTRPGWLRHVSGFVVLDIAYKYDRSVPELEQGRQNLCAFAQFYRDLLAQGGYDLGGGAYFYALGSLAATDPSGPSPLLPGLTNLQAALWAGSVPDPVTFVPWYHYVAGVFEGGLPVDLRFSSIPAWLDFLQAVAPYEPTSFGIDYCDILCDEIDTPFDDRLGDIVNPVLYVGANGGFGRAGHYTLDLLGSTDKEIVNVSLAPPEALDFAHVDLSIAENAPAVVWPSILSWIEDHGRRPETLAEAESPARASGFRVTPNPGGAAPYTFDFTTATSGEVLLEVFDVAGRRITAPFSGVLPAGQQRVVWSGWVTGGGRLSDGVFFARITTPESVRTERFVHVRR